MEFCHTFHAKCYSEHPNVPRAGISPRLESGVHEQFYIHFLTNTGLVYVSMCTEFCLRYAFIITRREIVRQ